MTEVDQQACVRPGGEFQKSVTGLPEVLVTRRVPEAGMELISRECRVRLWEGDGPIPRERLLKLCEGVEGILCLLTDQIDREVIARAGPKLKVISVMAVGYDNVDLAEAGRRGIVVGNTPGVLTEATADLTWALILAVSRKIVEGDRLMRSGRFTGWAPMLLLGADFAGRTIGIVGMGRIGKAVARRSLGFGMKVIYADPQRLEPTLEQELHAQYLPLHELIAKADFVCLHCPLSEETRHLIGERELSMMKPGAYLINVSRGPVVDEAALVAALKAGKIAGAGLDVYEHEPMLAAGLSELSNVVLAPHLGSASIETRNKMAVMAARNLLAGISGRVPPYCVNPPARDQ